MNKFLSIGQISKLMSVLLPSLYYWLKTGKIKEAFKTLGQHRGFNLNQLEQALHCFSLINQLIGFRKNSSIKEKLIKLLYNK